MREVKFFLAKYQGLTSSDAALKKILIEVVAKHTGVKLEPTEIQVAKSVVYLKTKPAAKSEIFLHRQQIFSDLNKIMKKTTSQHFV